MYYRSLQTNAVQVVLVQNREHIYGQESPGWISLFKFVTKTLPSTNSREMVNYVKVSAKSVNNLSGSWSHTCKIYTLLCHTGKTINRLFYYHSVMHRLKRRHTTMLMLLPNKDTLSLEGPPCM